jgi:hypothetical protein
LSSVVMQHPHDCSAIARTECEVGFVEGIRQPPDVSAFLRVARLRVKIVSRGDAKETLTSSRGRECRRPATRRRRR